MEVRCRDIYAFKTVGRRIDLSSKFTQFDGLCPRTGKSLGSVRFTALKFPVKRIPAPDDVPTSIVINSVCTDACLRLDLPTGIEAVCIRPEPDIIGMN